MDWVGACFGSDTNVLSTTPQNTLLEPTESPQARERLGGRLHHGQGCALSLSLPTCQAFAARHCPLVLLLLAGATANPSPRSRVVALQRVLPKPFVAPSARGAAVGVPARRCAASAELPAELI